MTTGDGAVGQSEKSPPNSSRDTLTHAAQPAINEQVEVTKTANTASIHLPGFELSPEVKPGVTGKTTIDVDGKARDVWLHLPANYDASKPVPLMLVFNGVGPGGSGMEDFTSMSKKADEQGFAVAYLDGSGFGHSYHTQEWRPSENGDNDVKYTSQVIDTLENDLSIDRTRVGLVGFSQGGAFAHLAASQLSGKVSSVAEVEGWMSGQESRTSSPVSELSIHGMDDRIIPFGGTTQLLKDTALKVLGYAAIGPLTDVIAGVSNKLHGDSPLSLTPVELAAVAFQELHNVYIEPQTYTTDQYKKDDQITGNAEVQTQGNVTRTVYRNDKTGAEVEQIALKHGEHAWNGSTFHKGDIPLIGEPSNDINTTDEIANFFMNHPKPTE